jgi:hypothetical protein
MSTSSRESAAVGVVPAWATRDATVRLAGGGAKRR